MNDTNDNFVSFDVAGVPVMCTIDGVKVISVCALIEHLYPKCFGRPYSEQPSYKERCVAVAAWCGLNKAHSYERDRENFSKHEAACEARALGLNVVVVEDLS